MTTSNNVTTTPSLALPQPTVLDDSQFTPMQELIIETLIARRRLGEQFWTFTRKPAITTALRALENNGWVDVDYGNVENTWRVWLSGSAMKTITWDKYLSPLEKRVAVLETENTTLRSKAALIERTGPYTPPGV
ncbi:hypothetical protein [Aeromicrobium sp. 179-A 4D2 NHS]|uniref:hypothetical protein n=1 Tax=Aeromicrobium sp. 179-A 4D2 NHS TaxID=3142375 RepID=UPI00399FC86E